MKTKEIQVVEDKEKLVPADIMAQAIVDIGDAMRKIAHSRLNRKALVTLISDSSGLPKYKVELVLNNLDSLETIYLKPRFKK